MTDTTYAYTYDGHGPEVYPSLVIEKVDEETGETFHAVLECNPLEPPEGNGPDHAYELPYPVRLPRLIPANDAAQAHLDEEEAKEAAMLEEAKTAGLVTGEGNPDAPDGAVGTPPPASSTTDDQTPASSPTDPAATPPTDGPNEAGSTPEA